MSRLPSQAAAGQARACPTSTGRLGGRKVRGMASKDKGTRSSKTVAAKTAKEKKSAKREKKQARERTDRTA